MGIALMAISTPFVFKEPKLDLIEANPVSDHKFSFNKRFVVFL